MKKINIFIIFSLLVLCFACQSAEHPRKKKTAYKATKELEDDTTTTKNYTKSTKEIDLIISDISYTVKKDKYGGLDKLQNAMLTLVWVYEFKFTIKNIGTKTFDDNLIFTSNYPSHGKQFDFIGGFLKKRGRKHGKMIYNDTKIESKEVRTFTMSYETERLFHPAGNYVFEVNPKACTFPDDYTYYMKLVGSYPYKRGEEADYSNNTGRLFIKKLEHL